MNFSAQTLQQHIIAPTLRYLDMYTPTAERQLLGAAAQAAGEDPLDDRDEGIGLYQITPQQHRRAWDDYLAFRPDLASKVRGLASQHQFLREPDAELRSNLAYSTAIAWILCLQNELSLQKENCLAGDSATADLIVEVRSEREAKGAYLGAAA